MDDIDWMDTKEKDDTIRELRQKLAKANKRIAELELQNKDLRSRIKDLNKEKEHWHSNFDNCVLRRVEDKQRIAELEQELEEVSGELIHTESRLRDELYPRKQR